MINAPAAWIKQHRRLFAVIVAAGVVGVFLFLKRGSSSTGQSVSGTILPPATGGGGASGSGGSYYVPPGTITVQKPPTKQTLSKLAAVIRGLLNPETHPAQRKKLLAEYHQLTGKPWVGKPVSDRDPRPKHAPKPPVAHQPGRGHLVGNPTKLHEHPLGDRRAPRPPAPHNPHRDRQVVA